MSFLALARMPAVYTTATTRFTPALTVTAARSISSTTPLSKGPLDKTKDATKDTLRKADRHASKGAIKGLEVGERAQDKMRNAVGIQTQKAKGKAEHMGDEPGETAGQGRGKAAEESLGTERPDVKDLSGRTG